MPLQNPVVRKDDSLRSGYGQVDTRKWKTPVISEIVVPCMLGSTFVSRSHIRVDLLGWGQPWRTSRLFTYVCVGSTHIPERARRC